MTNTTIAINFATAEEAETFDVKWQGDQTVSEELLSKTGSLVIYGLSPNKLYNISVTAHLRGGPERSPVINVLTIGKWCWYVAQFLQGNVTI